MAEDLRNIIGGRAVDPVSERRSDLVNPSTGEVFATAPVSGAADVDAAFDAAAAAFEGWRDATPADRSLALLRIADAIEARGEEFVAIESENTACLLAGNDQTERSAVSVLSVSAACSARCSALRARGASPNRAIALASR